LRVSTRSCPVMCSIFLSADNVHAIIQDAWRILEPSELPCLTSLTHGRKPLSRLVKRGGEGLHRAQSTWVGGCRPLNLDARRSRNFRIG